MKKIAAMLAAAAVASSFGVSAFAEKASQEQKELVQIGEYECWVEDGQYFTELDDEIYLVINLDELEWESEDIALYSDSDTYNGTLPVDLSDGSHYEAYVDLRYGDFTTPTFIGYYVGATEIRSTYAIRTEFFGTLNIR